MSRASSKLRRSIALFAVAALALAACGNDDDDNDAGSGSGDQPTKTVKIAFVGPLTGDAANLGINIRDGIKVAVDEAKKAGGNVRVEMVEFDTQGDAAQATTIKDRYINDTSIIGIVGPTFSGETRAVLPDLAANGLVMISASATNVALPTLDTSQKVFHRVIPDDDVQGKGVADYIVKKLNAKTVAYVHDNTDYGKALAEGTQKLVEPAGARTALVEAIDPKAQDYSAAVNKVRGAAPDVIFYGGYYAEAGRLKKQLTDAGVKGTFVSGDGALDPGFIASGGSGAEGAQITCPCNLATADSPGKAGEFARNYKTLNGKDPGTYSTEGYDAANIFIQGIKAGNDDRPKLLDYVEKLDSYDGISKRISFEANGNVKATGVFFFEVKGGKLTLLGSTDELLK
ncbi:MAG TPA: branched-chain amino acid ABC transporter substrate-binding protein [Acidimicrobiales bacterium]|nr:branched-chain amino acid ABC transporter substrate-binding protein [Acidimicrobiales bacterium]